MAAAENQSYARLLLNPLAFQIQKLGLELKCPLCLNLLTKPMLLPCDHVFCNFCVPRSDQFGCECPVCKHQCIDQDIRAASHMENIITTYRSLHATFNANVFQSKSPDAGRSLEQSPISVNADEKSRNEKPVKATVVSRNDSNKEVKRQNGRNSAEEIDLNQLQQQSPDSSLSSDNNKDFTVRNTDTKGLIAKKSVEESSDIFQERDVKRQKKLSYGLSETILQSQAHNQQRDSCSEIIAYSDHNLMCKSSETSLVAQPKAISEQHLLEGTVCALCHSSKITEGTGPMLYYANGKDVMGDVTSLSNVMPVHTNCLDWAPQVYYDGEIIKNLEAELARASKLKCSGCGLKGAAVGCLVRSCRKSYHLPCALEIHDCRWDCDSFVMLCPSHKSVKFPSEKSSSRKRASKEVCPASTPITTEKLSFWATLSNGPKEWVLCGSALSSEEKFTLVKFATICGATVCKTWEPNVTHVIASTDEKGACTRTLKVLMAILSGKWILTIDWIKACMEANCPMNEEPYEIGLDNHGCFGGPKAGRLRASTNAPKLFDGFKFYLSGDYVTAYKNDLLDLVENAGGSIAHTKEELMDQTCLVVYNCDPPRGCMPGEETSILLKRRAEAEDLAKKIDCHVIQHTWILESIAACKLAPLC